MAKAHHTRDNDWHPTRTFQQRLAKAGVPRIICRDMFTACARVTQPLHGGEG